jgi:uncharacterized low-complexity protein
MKPRGTTSRILVVLVALAAMVTAALLGNAAIGSSSNPPAGASAEQAQAAKKKCKKKHAKGKCRKRRVTQVRAAPAVATAASKPVVYTVPKNIKSDCSVAVEDKLMAWLSTVPDGSTVRFGTGRCYGQDGTITLTGRKGLTIDGQGSEFRALTMGGSHRSNWHFVGGNNLTVRNLAVRGSNPQGTYDHAVEWQHGLAIDGVQGMTLSNVGVREVWGDGIDLWHGAPSPTCGDDASSARDVLISGATLERIGRQGVAVVDAEQVTIQDSTIGPVAWANVDLETDDACEIARHVTVARNSFGSNGWGVIVNGGFGADPQVGDLTVSDNTQTAPTTDTGILTPDPCRAPVRILAPDGAYRSSYSFTGNHFLATLNGLVFRRVNDVDVTGNTVSFTPTTGCDSRTGVRLVDSHTVTITGNAFSGASTAYSADPASTDIIATGNTL